MPDDLEVIAKIEKNIGMELKVLLMSVVDFTAKGFALGDGGRVVALNLYKCKLTDISPLQSLTQ